MNGFDFTTLTANSANYANLCIVVICLIRLIRRLEQIILFCVANALRILPTQTKYILELSLIVVFICHELSLNIAP